MKEAAIWLELQEVGLGERFLEEVAQAQRLILEYPDAWHPLGPRLRRCHLKRFRHSSLLNSELKRPFELLQSLSFRQQWYHGVPR